MPDELVGRIIKPFRYSRIKTDLPHEDKEGENRVSVVRDDLKDISPQKIHGGIKTVEVGKTGESDQGHGKPQLDTGGEKEQ
jgi:hypothetical protein